VNPAGKAADVKKMVDGKGGNLKTIHHYKTERVFCYHTTFQIIFDEGGGWKGGKTIHRSAKHKPYLGV
jgi:hypothetical protein